MSQSAIFCGVVRNGGSALKPSLDALDSVRETFARTKFIVVTNDNSDGTADVLSQWERLLSQNVTIHADGLLDAFPNRVDRICAARNIYMAEVHRELTITRWDYVIVADLDGPNQELDAAWFRELSDLQLDWDALFANQSGPYYDLFALRHRAWCPGDCWAEVDDLLPSLIGRIPVLRGLQRRHLAGRLIAPRQHLIPAGHEPIAVASAFGGLGIYRARSIVGCWYGSRTRVGRPICEHVPFNRRVVRNGGRLYIMPGLLNSSPPEHLSYSSGTPFPGYPDET
jgi:hypothetical protein